MTILEFTSKVKKGRRDPTRSAGLRRAGRALVTKRVLELNKQLRLALDQHDILGLRQDDTFWSESNSQVLQRTETVFRQMVERTITGDWLDIVIQRAVERGVRQAGQEIRQQIERINLTELIRFHNLATAQELQGISGETQKRLLRHVAKALETSALLLRDIRETLEKVTRFRLTLLVNTSVVRALNAGKLLVYAEFGIKQVGIEAEWLPPKTPRFHDALVNVLTAGDDAVCEDCEDIAAGGPYEIDEAGGLIPAHPNCRCAFTPADDERFAETEEREERLEEEREERRERRERRRRDEDDDDD